MAIRPVNGRSQRRAWIRWGVRDSFVEYLRELPDSRIEASGGAIWTDDLAALFPVTEQSGRLVRTEGVVELSAHEGALAVRIDSPAMVASEDSLDFCWMKGGSLLASGVTGVEGDFARGDPVFVRDPQGRTLAQGLAEYASAEVDTIKGRRSEEQQDLLGYAPRSAVIHRDQLVLL